MSDWMTIMTELRSVARKVGLTKAVQRLRSRLPGDHEYETKVRQTLETEVRVGDTVWDVGANVGLYTELFSRWVGPSGHVVAFEPVPSCFEELRERTAGSQNITALNIGLSDVEAELPMYLEEDGEGTTHTFVAANGAARQATQLLVSPADHLREADQLPIPNVLKVDVEGFELEALRGLDETLRDPSCRMLLCEVHFAILEAKGQKQGPREIQRYLRHRGFSTRWIDASHLVASRASSTDTQR
jgi:FkbM family methyltransferase